MNCMKCGKELKVEGVFCPECLAEMEKYPVKPNITIQLPIRRATPTSRKKSRRQRYVKVEDQIRHLKKVRNWLIGILIFLIVSFSAAVAVTLHMMYSEEGFGIGQNYSTIDQTDET